MLTPGALGGLGSLEALEALGATNGRGLLTGPGGLEGLGAAGGADGSSATLGPRTDGAAGATAPSLLVGGPGALALWQLATRSPATTRASERIGVQFSGTGMPVVAGSRRLPMLFTSASRAASCPVLPVKRHSRNFTIDEWSITTCDT